MIRLSVVGCWFAVLASWTVTCLERDQLFPFGTHQSDTRLSVGDDISSSEIDLQTPIKFFDNSFSTVFVNLNGLISFETEIPSYMSSLILPFGYKVIAPFFADIDIRLSGNVYYRETHDPSLIGKATSDILRAFPSHRSFRPSSLFIATWDDVGYYDKQYEPTNTFQVVIASDRRDSFAVFMYPNDGVNWIRGEGKDRPLSEDVPAQAGFDSGDGNRYYTLPGSGNPEVTKLTTWSNCGSDGVWIFRIGNTQNIETPATHSRDGDASDASGARTCSDGGQRTCNTNAKCNDFTTGYCCECNAPYIGNGLECIRPEEAQRISGKVSGTVNGVTLDDVDLHAYIVTADGRTYTAISRIPPSLGQSLLELYGIGSILGFTFALPQQPAAKNGFMITGGNFNRTAVVQFPSRETMTIRQKFTGPDVPGHMRMSTTLDGSLPRIPENAKVEIDDYKEDYRRTAPGVLKLLSQHAYRVDGVAHRFTVDETINFKECSAQPLTGLDNLRLSVTRNFVVYTDKEQIVRFSQTNKISVGGASEDPCRTANCDSHATCQPQGSGYQCVCNKGYHGDGRRCQDIDECRQGGSDCHQAAACFNTEGSFECRCRSGYVGDGRSCQIEISDERDTCRELQNCDSNADCTYSSTQRSYVCECRQGYQGDGYYCDEVSIGIEDDCTVAAICDANAQCILNENTHQYACQCNEGFEGDGRSCSKRDCRRDSRVCDENARCERRGHEYECVCSPGFRGDGYHTCVSGAERTSYLLYAQGMYVMETPFSPTPTEPGKLSIYIPGQTVIGVDVDCYTRYLYWTDVSGKTISRSRLDGTDAEVLVRNLNSPEGVAVDWLSKNIYWTDSGSDRIQMSRMNGSNHKTLFSDGLVNPRSIVVDPARGVMFWTDWNRESPKIEKANMDGTDRKVLVSEGLTLPNGLALDYDGQMVCWADAGTRKVECVTYEGRSRRVVSNAAGYPFGLVFANNVFYWTDWERTTLRNTNRNSDQPNEDIILPPGANGRLYGITTVRSPCPSGSNSCAYNNGGCRFLCLPTSRGGRTCACPDDIEPDECNRIALL